MQRALIAGVLLAALLALLGIFVMLKKMAFFADGIAHASLAGVAVGILFSWSPLGVALAVSVIFSLIVYYLETKHHLASDTTIGIIFTTGMALGVILLSFSPGYQPELISFLFGNVLSVSNGELWLIMIVSVVAYAFILKYLKSLTLMTMDVEMARLTGARINILQPALYVILAVAVVLGIKVLGIILVSGLLIIPVAVARLFSSSFRQFSIWGIVMAETMVVLGIIFSYLFDLPTGPAIILTGSIMFVIGIGMSFFGKKR